MEEVKTKPNYGKAVSFLLLEILAVISFSLGSSFIFFAILSTIILVLITIVTFRQIKKDGLSSFGFFLFPLLIFTLLTVVSPFKSDPYFMMSNSPGLFLIPLGLICFAASGYLINVTGSFKIRQALVVIYSGIALLTFINLVVTMVQFVPFYTLRYSDSYYYYNGSPSSEPIGNMAYFLMSFSMVEVSLSYFSFYPIILLTSFLALSQLKYRENKKLFIMYLCFGILGLLSLIFTINKITLIMLFIICLVMGVILIYTRYQLNTKPLKIVMGVFGGLFVIGLIVLFLNAQDSVGVNMRIDWLRQLTTSNPFFNRLFNSNRFVSGYNSILDGTFAFYNSEGGLQLIKLLGYPINGEYVDLFGFMTWKLRDSNSFFFDTFFTSGFFGFLFIMGFVVVGIRKVFLYYKNSEDNKTEKVTILGFILVSLTYAFINYDLTPLIFNKTIIPFFMNNIFFIDLFLFGYCYFNSNKKVNNEEIIKEEEINNETQSA